MPAAAYARSSHSWVHYDAKVVHVGVSTYADTNGVAASRGAAVNSRARRVVGEYERHARRIDEHC